MDDEQKQPSPFEQAVAKIRARYAWYSDHTIEMLPYSEVFKLIDRLMDEVARAHLQTIACACADTMFRDLEYMRGLDETVSDAMDTIDRLKEHLRAAKSTIQFEKRTRLELPRDAHGNRIYPYSKLEQWGAIEDFWYCNGHWQVRGHDISAPWLPADQVVVCTEDREDEPEESSDQATHTSKRPRGCRTRSEAEQAIRSYCLGNISAMELLNLLIPDDNPEEA
jgi:hypothetical protein